MGVIIKKIQNSSRINRYKQYFWDIFINEIVSSYLCPLTLRGFLLRVLGLKLEGGDTTAIHAKCYFASNRFAIGKGSYINRECFFDNAYALVEIGEGCSIGYRITFLTTNHVMSNSNNRGGNVEAKGIHVGNGVWIGANAIILPGVTIGDGAVIAAGSLVARACEPNSLYGGIPARKIKDL
jgi:maltose O-acetyltransferase